MFQNYNSRHFELSFWVNFFSGGGGWNLRQGGQYCGRTLYVDEFNPQKKPLDQSCVECQDLMASEAMPRLYWGYVRHRNRKEGTYGYIQGVSRNTVYKCLSCYDNLFLWQDKNVFNPVIIFGNKLNTWMVPKLASVICRTQIFWVLSEYEHRFLSIFEHEHHRVLDIRT